MPSSWMRHHYQHVADSEDGEELKTEKTSSIWRQPIFITLLALVSLVAGVSTVTHIYGTNLIHETSAESLANENACQDVSVRREWRTLSSTEKLEYIHAVQCMQTKDSQVGAEQSLYEDFAWLHAREELAHGTAEFLSWHRYFLLVFEEKLRESCGYRGSLPYWDWSLEWEYLPDAPVWDTDLGFGGNGTASDETVVGDGLCVTEGPFARLELVNDGYTRNVHCLSRTFINDEEEFRSRGRAISPEELEDLLTEDDYGHFNYDLEMRAHNALHILIRGDFSTLAAPNDPVFFLHHAQLDRMWWKWQNYSPDHRWAYNEKEGLTINGTVYTASVDDTLSLSPLEAPITVAEIMDTESGRLCYRY